MKTGLAAPEQERFASQPIVRQGRTVWVLGLFTILLFCQAWWDVAGFTIRAEDILALILLGGLLLPVLLTGRLCYYRNPLNVPLLLWIGVLLLGVAVTLLSPFDAVTKKDALVNGIRLALAIAIFFVFHRHPAPAEAKLKVVLYATWGFSLITTLVALLQIGYWDGWLPIRLPSVLTTFKEGASTGKGREVFALYLGDTGSHTWSGALAMQALLAWLLGRYSRHPVRKWVALSYFGLLVFILIRISVRNSIVGLFLAIVGLEVVRSVWARHLLTLVLRLGFVLFVVVAVVYILLYLVPDTYFIERVRQVIPRFEQGQWVIERGSNLYGRLVYWATALQIFSQSPFIGSGFYSFQALSGVIGPKSTVHAHNSYLQTLAEFGFLGGVVLAGVLFRIGTYLWRSRGCFLPRSSGRFWWEFAAGNFIFWLFTMLFANPFWLPNPVAFRMIVLGVLASLIRERVT